MIPGLNTNVTYSGSEYHVQTEDLGRQNPYVLTLVFRAGAIISREKVNYREVLGDGAPEVQIKRFMDQQHQRIIQDIQSGRLEKTDGSELAQQPSTQTEPPPPKAALSAADENLDQLITEYLQSRNAAKPR